MFYKNQHLPLADVTHLNSQNNSNEINILTKLKQN